MLIGRILNILRGLLYPSDLSCVLCGDEQDVDNRYGVCQKCRLGEVTRFCKVCGIKIYGAKEYCDGCLHKDYYDFDEARAPFCFDSDEIKRLVYRYKYYDCTYLAKYMAEFMADTFYKQNWNPDIICYVPIHKYKRIFNRGYDQSRLIAEQLSKILDLPVVHALEKVVYSKKSTARMGKQERLDSIKHTFISNEPLNGKNVLLVDDVFTSGATTSECARILKLDNAKRVWALSFATSAEKLLLYSFFGAKKKSNRFMRFIKDHLL